MQPDQLARSSPSKADRDTIIIAATRTGHEVGMNGRAQNNLERILLEHFPNVRTVANARAIGVDAWLLAHVAPLGWEHIGLIGDYVWTEANPAAPFRPLREVRSMFQPMAA